MQVSNWLLQQTCDRLATNVEPALCNQKLYYQKLYYIILALHIMKEILEIRMNISTYQKQHIPTGIE